MNVFALPWVELTVLCPLVGSLVVALLGNPRTAQRWCLGFTLATLACSLLPWLALFQPDQVTWRADITILGVDNLSAPLLPLVALLHALTVLATARIKATRLSFALLLLAESLRLATFACPAGWPLVVLLSATMLTPYLEMVQRRRPTRVYLIHAGLFVALLVAGWAGLQADLPWASTALLAAVLVRSGTFPAHLWVADLFEHSSFGGALLVVAPLAGVYAAVRLVLPYAPDWVLSSLGFMSLLTALYAAGMAVVQREVRRFFAYLFLSHAAMVLAGLELHTAISLTGSLCLWVSVALSLSGLGLVLRALEARCGRLTLTGHRGLYEQSPALAVCFLVAGLGSVGFPGTIGFVATELLADGAVAADVVVGIGLVVAGAINGIAILRVYFLLFTGKQHQTAVPLGITPQERFAVLTLAALILGGGILPQPGIANRYEVAARVRPEKPVPVPSTAETPAD